MQVNLTFRAPEIEGTTPAIMVEMTLETNKTSPIIQQIFEAATGYICTVKHDTGIPRVRSDTIIYRAVVRTEAYDPWTIGLSLLVQRLRNHGFDVKLI